MLTTTEVPESLQFAHMVHFACHGIQHKIKPRQSHLCLKSAPLTVAKLMNFDLKGAFFAFLSACETANGDERHGDEAVHLAAAMLLFGLKGVVAMIWKVFRRQI
jgi:CHAT domain-containing protein